MDTDIKVRAHHQKFFEGLRVKSSKQEKELLAPRIALKEQAALALKATNGNQCKAARLLGWPRVRLRYYLGLM